MVELTISSNTYFEDIGYYLKSIDCYRDTIFQIILLDIPYEHKAKIFEEVNKLYENLEKLNKGGNND